MDEEQPIFEVSTAEPFWQNTCARLAQHRVAMRIHGVTSANELALLGDIAREKGMKLIPTANRCAIMTP